MLLALPMPASFAADQPEIQSAAGAEIRRLLENDSLTIAGTEILAQDILLQTYSEVGFEPFWTDTADIRELLDLIGSAEEHGLRPEDYGETAVRQVLSGNTGTQTAPEMARADILLTESLLRYGYHRRFGKITASRLDPDINFRRETFNNQRPGTNLRQALGSTGPCRPGWNGTAPWRRPAAGRRFRRARRCAWGTATRACSKSGRGCG
jgi:hypothetical protein